ncbi:MAG: type III secretion system cytoplasmic ring protein SctQ [Parvibaculaceae bacterium]|nr:type III secretion system cytoplasmic ring protein SctQ [Parvibaculaceae bacterium]
MIVRTRPDWQLDNEDNNSARRVSIRPIDHDVSLPEDEVWSADYRFSDKHITLSFGEHVLDFILAGFGVTRAIGDMPPALSAALMERALDMHRGILNSILGIEGQIGSAGRKASPLPSIGYIALENADGSMPLQGEIHCDVGGARLFSRALGALSPVPKYDVTAIPIPLRIMAGSTCLPLSLFRRLTAGCIVLFDRTALSDNAVLLRASRHMVFRGRLNASTITLEEGPIAMSDSPFEPDQVETDLLPKSLDDPASPLESAATHEQSEDPFDAIEIELAFDLGTQEIPAGELALLGPGHIFDLGRDVRRQVRISANGRLIGYGDLVQIDERTGVRIHKLLGRRDS